MQGTEHLTELEKKRAIVIARNRARLEALGIHVAAQELSQVARPIAKSKKSESKASQAPKQRDRTQDKQPTRRSKRRKTGGAQAQVDGEEDEANEEEVKLATFIIDGECPKCGKVVTRGHKKHLSSCEGRSDKQAGKSIPLADLVELEVKRMKNLEHKLTELEIGGLIDLSDEQASFMVVGSTGKHYRVDMSDEKRKCQCVDHRIRKHDCKHIRLMLKTLGIENDPQAWHSATEILISLQASQLADAVGCGGGASKHQASPQVQKKSASPSAVQRTAQAFL